MLIVDVQHPETPDRKLRVGVLGSCRARDLLVNVYKSDEAEKALGSSIPCETVAHYFGIFTHTPSQARQYYHFLRNRNEFMEEIQPLFFWRPLAEVQGQLKFYTPDLLDSIDMMVVEASTLNNFTCDGIELSASYVEQKFVKVGGKPLLKWWRSVSMGKGEVSQEIVDETLAALPSKSIPNTPNIRSIIENLRLRVESRDQFHQSLSALATEVNVPMVVLPHFDLIDAPIAARHPLRNYINEFSHDIGYHVFDTTDLIAEYGREVALAGEGTSICHYSHSFHHTLLNSFRPFLHDVYDQVNSHGHENRRIA